VRRWGVADQPVQTSFPLKEFLGFEMEREDGRASAVLTLDERHLNPNGIAHGAVAFALMDTAMGAAVMTVVPEGSICATIEMHSRFHRAAASGTLRAESTVLNAGRRIVHVSSRIVDDRDRLVASATASFAVIAPKPA
jgi:acyl-CoA thioesterase